MIPLSTTTIEVRRPDRPTTEDPYGEGYDAPGDRDDDVPTVVSGVRAVISPATARGSDSGGQSELVEFVLKADPCDISYLDIVEDEVTGDVYDVEWAHSQPGVAGLAHVTAGLRTTKGRTP